MTATAAATVSPGTKPIFGGSTAGVTYANVITGSGNTTTGKFDFTVGGGPSPIAESAGVADIAVTATKTSVDGNESAWSTPVNITYDKTPPTLSFSQASYGFANAAGAKTFNLTASETLQANAAGLPPAGIHDAQYIKTFTVNNWTVAPTLFKIDNFASGTAVSITSDALADDTASGGPPAKPSTIVLGTLGTSIFKDIAGNKLTNATVTINP